MRKCLLVLSLAALCSIAANDNASAQTSKSLNFSSFTVPNQPIKVTHTVLQKSTPGSVTFKLTSENGKALESGKSFIMTLPAQNGLTYDLSTLPGVKSVPFGAGALPTLTLNSSAAEAAAFSCKLIKTSSRQPANQQIFIRIN